MYREGFTFRNGTPARVLHPELKKALLGVHLQRITQEVVGCVIVVVVGRQRVRESDGDREIGATVPECLTGNAHTLRDVECTQKPPSH
jgi:hypothetical protein